MVRPMSEGSAQTLVADLEARGVTRAKIGGFDVDGVLRGKYVSLEKLKGALDGGFGFCDVIFGWDIADVLYDNAKVTGWDTGYPDTLARISIVASTGSPSRPSSSNVLSARTEGS